MEIVKKHAQHPGDTGSAGVQIAILTERINGLAAHLKASRKDHSTQRGLLNLVGNRRTLLTYLKRSDAASYGKILKQLDLRK